MKILIICLLPSFILLPACGLFKKKPEPIKINPNVRLAGRVHKVDLAAKFILIRRYGPWRLGDGEVVESRGEGRTASLLPTGERLGEHVAADIRSGAVEAGDAVYIRRIASPEKPRISRQTVKSGQSNNQDASP